MTSPPVTLGMLYAGTVWTYSVPRSDVAALLARSPRKSEPGKKFTRTAPHCGTEAVQQATSPSPCITPARSHRDRRWEETSRQPRAPAGHISTCATATASVVRKCICSTCPEGPESVVDTGLANAAAPCLRPGSVFAIKVVELSLYAGGVVVAALFLVQPQRFPPRCAGLLVLA